jgi:hypothetical protein
MAERTLIEAEITFLPKSEGGRDIPDGIFQGLRYRPHIVIGDPLQRQPVIANGNRLTETYLPVAFVDGPQHIEPGQPVKTTMGLMFQPHPDCDAVVPGATFTLREGRQIIAYGEIERRWNEQIMPHP